MAQEVDAMKIKKVSLLWKIQRVVERLKEKRMGNAFGEKDWDIDANIESKVDQNP